MLNKFNLIVARCSNNGIGYKGDLPWSLRKEMEYFNRMTKGVKDPEKKNVVIMGRRTWESLPEKLRPLPHRYNIVLSSKPLDLKGAVQCKNFDEVVKVLNSPDFVDKVETAWVIGGTRVYEDAINLDLCHRVYLTKIMKEFECDTFLNTDFSKGFKEVSDERVPAEIQEENGINYMFCVYEKIP